MSDSPERIWIDVELYEHHWHAGEMPDGYVHARGPYIRADHINELIAAAYEAAVEICDNAPPKGNQTSVNLETESAHWCSATIRVLTPADATAALAARDARVREAALREAAEVCKTAAENDEADNPKDIANAILTLITNDTTNG